MDGTGGPDGARLERKGLTLPATTQGEPDREGRRSEGTKVLEVAALCVYKRYDARLWCARIVVRAWYTAYLLEIRMWRAALRCPWTIRI